MGTERMKPMSQEEYLFIRGYGEQEIRQHLRNTCPILQNNNGNQLLNAAIPLLLSAGLVGVICFVISSTVKH